MKRSASILTMQMPTASVVGCGSQKENTTRRSLNLTKLFGLKPSERVFYFYRGRAWYSKGTHDRAIADLDEAIRIDPNFADAYNERGRVWLAKGEYDKAITQFDEAIRLKPSERVFYTTTAIQPCSRKVHTTRSLPIPMRQIASVPTIWCRQRACFSKTRCSCNRQLEL